MQWLRYFSRVAFIFNLCFSFALLIRHIHFPQAGVLVSLIIILGYPLAFFVNFLLNICYGILLVFKKKWLSGVPVWLIIVNFFFLIAEAIAFAKNGL